MLKLIRCDEVNDWEKELKRRVRKERRREFWESLRKWLIENPQYAIMLMLAGLGAAAKIFKGAAKTVQTIAEETSKSRRIYDHRLGKYHYLKRGLKQHELLELTERLSNGEKMVDILMNMGVLKG